MEYKVQLQCQSGKPVVTVIICTYHIKSEVYLNDARIPRPLQGRG